MWSMWNAPSDRDYYDALGLDCDVDEPEICGDCRARWDLGEGCEEWCETNRPVARTGTGKLPGGRRARGHFLRKGRNK